METRPYFVFGDIVSNLAVGALVGVVCALLFPTWHVVVAMIAGMVLGMVVSFPTAFLLSSLFGALEIVLPVMTTGMVAGMVVAMRSNMAALPLGDAAWLGGLCGVGVLMATYVANALINPRAKRWTT